MAERHHGGAGGVAEGLVASLRELLCFLGQSGQLTKGQGRSQSRRRLKRLRMLFVMDLVVLALLGYVAWWWVGKR